MENYPNSHAGLAESGSVSEDMMCLACGYNLRGLGRAAACSECGLSIHKTITARQSMTKRELAALAFRVLVLWYFLWLIAELLELVQAWDSFYADIEVWMQIVFVVGVSVGSLGLLWWKADLIAKYAIRVDGPLFLSGQVMTEQVMSMAVAIMGLIYIVYGVVGGCGVLANFLINSQLSSVYQQYLLSKPAIDAVIHLAVGWVLLFGVTRISRFIVKLRSMGSTRTS